MRNLFHAARRYFAGWQAGLAGQTKPPGKYFSRALPIWRKTAEEMGITLSEMNIPERDWFEAGSDDGYLGVWGPPEEVWVQGTALPVRWQKDALTAFPARRTQEPMSDNMWLRKVFRVNGLTVNAVR